MAKKMILRKEAGLTTIRRNTPNSANCTGSMVHFTRPKMFDQF